MNVWCFRNNLSKICLRAVLTLLFCPRTSVCVPIIFCCVRMFVCFFLIFFFLLLLIASIFTFAFVCTKTSVSIYTERLKYTHKHAHILRIDKQMGRQRRLKTHSARQSVLLIEWLFNEPARIYSAFIYVYNVYTILHFVRSFVHFISFA